MKKSLVIITLVATVLVMACESEDPIRERIGMDNNRNDMGERERMERMEMERQRMMDEERREMGERERRKSDEERMRVEEGMRMKMDEQRMEMEMQREAARMEMEKGRRQEEQQFEKDKAIGLLPINKQSHLRPLATINQVAKCITILKSKPKIKRSMWSRRAQEYEAKISSGKIYDLAEVVRDLNKGDDLMIDQSYSERQLFEKAYDRLLTEFQIVIGTTLENAQKKLDKALKRNIEKQLQSTENNTQNNDLPVAEMTK